MKKIMKFISMFICCFALLFIIASCGKNNNKSNYSRKDDTIYFGRYPQVLVSDEELVSELNDKAGELPTAINTRLWTDYNYYDNEKVSSYMYYQDIDLDNDGIYDYRGVYAKKNRPHATYLESSDVTNPTIFWFEYKSIEWTILKEDGGQALIISNFILDSQEYCSFDSDGEFEHNGGIGYANNYSLSNIRKWLNKDFYTTAFDVLDKDIILLSEVDNSSQYINGQTFACENTFDKIYLLSENEVFDYKDKYNVVSEGTDYAKAQGLYTKTNPNNTKTDELGKSFWLTRTPCFVAEEDENEDSGNLISYVSTNGYIIESDYIDGRISRTTNGIRPVCWIKL